MGIKINQADENGPSCFGSPSQSYLHDTSTPSSSNNVSPGSVPSPTDIYKPRRIKTSLHARSRSDQPIRQRKKLVNPVAEESPHLLQKSAPASLASSKLSAASLIGEISTGTQQSRTPDPDQDAPPKIKSLRPGINWNPTYSGGVCFARPAGGNRRELLQSSSSPTSTSYFFRSSRGLVTPPPKPLRPPLTRSDGSTGLAYRHEVKLETSFTASIELPPAPQTPTKRRLSLNPKQIFSNTVLIARRLSLRIRLSKYSTEASQPPSQGSSQNLSLIHNLSHSTALRPTETASVLQRVTSILSETDAQKSPQSITLPRFLTNKSNFSPTSTGSGAHRAPTALPASDLPTGLTPPVSYTSSQRELRRGAVPTGTPEDNATYEVGGKVFFKVDISIRGGTSYLPSEARRIHTPPLPDEDLGAQGPMGPDGRRFVKMKPRGGILNETNETRASRMQRALTMDWYDVQLQLLESEVKIASKPDMHIDYSIPEHLVNSPLCPRNDRYWRYVQGKLKRGQEMHRVCWMHGMRDD